MAPIGYAGASLVGQSLAAPLDKAHALRQDLSRDKERRHAPAPSRRRVSGLVYVRDGDTRVVTRLDRLARSTVHLCTPLST